MKPPSLLLISAALLLSPGAAPAQSGIPPDMLQDLEKSCPVDAHFRAVQNALSQTDGSRIATSWQTATGIDAYFSNRLKDQKITDQKSTGRCWMFSALNTLRPVAALALNAEDLEFSQNYLFFYDKLEKANLFLEAVTRLRDRPLTDRTMEFLLRQPVQDGGNWLGFIELVKKYGVVPKDVMPETFSSSNSRTVNTVLGIRLKQYALRLRETADTARWTTIRKEALRDVYRILALNFGIPPSTFSWRYEGKDKKLSEAKTYSPRQFYTDVVHEALDDYFALYSIPTLPFARRYDIELDKAVADRPDMNFVNCPLETIKSLAMKCLLDNQPVWFGCDVGQETVSETGLMAPGVYDYASLYGLDFSMSRKELFETYSSTPNHNMVFTGVDVAGGKPVKWLVENSWSDKPGKKGYFTMTDEWFDRYVQVVVVHRKYIPAEILALFTTPPEKLPPWDPMFHALGLE
ncbi:MAG TPA: C1 family peptidase [Bacteroidota bacterium]|nr:C1 family peptidase [Bacteroidota bacterium]